MRRPRLQAPASSPSATSVTFWLCAEWAHMFAMQGLGLQSPLPGSLRFAGTPVFLSGLSIHSQWGGECSFPKTEPELKVTHVLRITQH